MQMREKIGKSLRWFSRVRPAPPAPGAAARPVVQAEVITGNPFLLPELEREIFELAAASDVGEGRTRQYVGKTMVTLPQVCRRAQSWIEPLIYERIQLLEWNGMDAVPQLLATIDARPANFFAAHVKHLYFPSTVPLPAVQRVLSVCTGAVSVGCHLPYRILAPLLVPLPLQRLCVSEFVPPSASADLSPWAASLTQLGLTQSLPPDTGTLFAALPTLTYLAVDFHALPNPDSDNPSMSAALVRLLAAYPRLHGLVLMAPTKADYRWAHQRLLHDSFADARFFMRLCPVDDATWDAWWRVPDLFVDAKEALERRRVVAAATVKS
ncbi:hypothetical protein B0H14DRAFT_2539354 [Mycena olivaceomarginata]|nr:hypothetical protein B0H14DRAFT_2539354 [Mycena olivaceomarginata]